MEFFLLHSWGVESCETAYASADVKKMIKTNEQFDLIIMEQFNTDCMLGLAWKLQAPVIGLSSCPLMPWHYDRIGNPIIPSYIPSLFMGYSDKMSFSERLANWIAAQGMKFLHS